MSKTGISIEQKSIKIQMGALVTYFVKKNFKNIWYQLFDKSIDFFSNDS